MSFVRRAVSRLVLWLVAKPAVFEPMVRVAAFHRRHGLRRLAFVAITGSSAKTTTKELAAAVLAALGPGRKTPHSGNDLSFVARTILKTMPWHRFAIAEVAAWGPNTLGDAVRLFRPRIGVVTNVGTDHYKAFRTLAATAAEKGQLVEAIPPDGTAVLNADDPHVLAMRGRCAGRVLTYGLSPGAELRAEEVSGAWPERLAFSIVHGGERLRVTTRLCGEHWVHSVLAALGAGLAAGVPLIEGIRRVERVEPWTGRMSLMEQADDVTFIRDDWKASLGTVQPALDFLGTARARRKIAVIGTLSDYGGTASAKYVAVARAALEAADRVLFVGPNAARCLRAKDGPRGADLHVFATVQEAAEHLRGTLEAGDLVLLKGSNPADHLVRIALARDGLVRCWRSSCGKKISCERCSLLKVPAAPDAIRPPQTAGAA